MTAEKDILDIPMIVTVSIVSTVLTIASVIGVQALYNSYADREIERKVTLAPTADADSKLAEQDAKLAKYGWVNREQGKVVIPIDRAMNLVVTDYAADQQPRETASTDSMAFSEPSAEEPRHVPN